MGGLVDSIVYLVLDTNVLLEDLSRIKEFRQKIEYIKDVGINGWTFELVIPHIVLQELDALKSVGVGFIIFI
jgi:predicted ribonuclease YlaK